MNILVTRSFLINNLLQNTALKVQILTVHVHSLTFVLRVTCGEQHVVSK